MQKGKWYKKKVFFNAVYSFSFLFALFSEQYSTVTNNASPISLLLHDQTPFLVEAHRLLLVEQQTMVSLTLHLHQIDLHSLLLYFFCYLFIIQTNGVRNTLNSLLLSVQRVVLEEEEEDLGGVEEAEVEEW